MVIMLQISSAVGIRLGCHFVVWPILICQSLKSLSKQNAFFRRPRLFFRSWRAPKVKPTEQTKTKMTCEQWAALFVGPFEL